MSISQSRFYELNDYIQLLASEVGYEDPSTIYVAVDKYGWDKAKRFPLIEFMNEFYKGQGQLYLNDGVPYADTAEVLANIPLADRTQYLTVNVAGTEYWFLDDLTTLVPKIGSLSLVDSSVTLAKMANVPTSTVFYRKSAGDGPPEIQTLATLRDDLNIPDLSSIKNVYTITLPAAGSLADRLAGVYTVPAGWSLAVDSDVNLIITHTLSTKTFVQATVKEVDGGGAKRLCIPFSEAYTGIIESDNTHIKIEGINPTAIDLELDLIFSI